MGKKFFNFRDTKVGSIKYVRRRRAKGDVLLRLGFIQPHIVNIYLNQKLSDAHVRRKYTSPCAAAFGGSAYTLYFHGEREKRRRMPLLRVAAHDLRSLLCWVLWNLLLSCVQRTRLLFIWFEHIQFCVSRGKYGRKWE